MVDCLKIVRSRFMKPSLSPGEMELNPVAVIPRFATDSLDLAPVVDSAEPPQCFAQDIALLLQLEFVFGMLVMTSAAPSEVLA